jgi:hypothetical protein
LGIKTINQDVPEILDVEWSVGGAGDRVKEEAGALVGSNLSL